MSQKIPANPPAGGTEHEFPMFRFVTRNVKGVVEFFILLIVGRN